MCFNNVDFYNFLNYNEILKSMTLRLLQTLCILVLLLGTTPLMAGNPSYIHWSFEQCVSNFNEGTNESYEEFVPEIFNSDGCTTLSMVNPTLYRDNPSQNVHSCAPGIDGGIAMCINSYAGCFFKTGQSEALKFDVQVTPDSATGIGRLSSLSFHELAPETFTYVDGISGPNNYPTRYAVTVFADGIEVYHQEDIQTTQEWTLEEFDFSNNPAFLVSAPTNFSFEILPYCFIGNGFGVQAWDIDELKIVSDCGDGIFIAGELTTYQGAQSVDLCVNELGSNNVSFLSTGTIAPNTTFVITDVDGNIIALPGAGPTFDFTNAGAGICQVYLIAHEGSINGATVGSNIAGIQGCFEISNPVTVNRELAMSGSISSNGATDIQFCGDATDFTVNPTVTGNQGAFNYWILTDGSNNVISVNAPLPYDFAGSTSTNFIYHLSTSDPNVLPPVGGNLFGMSGCYGLSNPITVNVYNVSPSVIDVDGLTTLEVCDSASQGAVNVNVVGGQGGAVYLITDLNGIILESQPSNTLNLNNIQATECQIYVIRTAGNLQNFAIGQSIFDIIGCYSLSNAINVVKADVFSSSITTSGQTSVTLCINSGDPVMVDVESTGGVGPNSTYIITDDVGNILEVPTGNPPFDFANAGAGVCILYEYYFEDVLTGAIVGQNISGITGCYAASNGITVRRDEVFAGTISTPDGTGTFTICEGSNESLTPTIVGNAGQSQWIIADANNNVLTVQSDLPLSFTGVNQPLCYVYNLSSVGQTNLTIGQNVEDIEGCIGLSNPILVDKTEVQASTIDVDGQTSISVCLNTTSAVYNLNLSGEQIGSSILYLVTDNAGNILEIQTGTSFDLSGANAGTCQIWQLVSTGGVTGAEVGFNVSGISGCYDLSNPVTIVRQSFTAATISTPSQSICLGSSQTAITFDVTGATAPLTEFVLVDASNNNIVQVSSSPTFDFGFYAAGNYTVYHLSSNGGLGGLSVGQNFTGLTGCFASSNPVTITTTNISAGVITSSLGSTISVCVGDGVSDPVDVSVTGNTGANNIWLITDASGNILEANVTPPFDFEGAGSGTCNIYQLTYEAGLTGASVGANISGLSGCFALSNPIVIVRSQVIAGTLSAPLNTICYPGQSGIISYTITGSTGAVSQFVLVDASNNILNISSSPTFDFGNYGQGNYTVYHVASSGAVDGLTIGSSINELSGCYGLSNGVPMSLISVTAGTISSSLGSTINLCVGNGNSPTVDVAVSGNSGASNQWVITDDQGNILELPAGPPFSFENAPAGVCQIWHLTYEGGLTGATIGANANALAGCFALSNPIIVNRNQAEAGIISLDDNTFDTNICVSDGTTNIINVNVQDASSVSNVWLITDAAGNILDVPASPPFNFNNYPTGTCQIFYLAYSGSITGATIGSNTSAISGCFDLSNQITVTKEGAQGGNISTQLGSDIYICVNDGVADVIDVNLVGNSGDNSQWLVTDPAGNILELPASNVFDFENAGIGTCLIWHLSYSDGLVGLGVGENASSLGGCFDLSNPITINRTEAEGGQIVLEDGTFEATYCTSDGEPDVFTVNLTGSIGTSVWVVTDTDGNIIDIPSGNTFDVEGTTGVCQIWNLSYSGVLNGAIIGSNVSQVSGCFDLSNPITITKNGTEGGEITSTLGTTVYACVGDGETDVVDVIHSGFVGPFTQCVVTDVDGVILEIMSGNTVDFEGAGVGVCYIQCITYQFGLAGVVVGMNVDDLLGCYDLSNIITVIRTSSEGGSISAGGLTEVDICLDSGDTFELEVELTGNSGENCSWVITDEDGTILQFTSGPPFVTTGSGTGISAGSAPGLTNFALTGSGTSSTTYIYNVCYGDDLSGLAVDWPITALSGCYDLSNPIEVNMNVSDAGTITTENGSNITLCTSDGLPDEIAVINSVSYGQFTEYILTDALGNILEVQNSNIFNFEGAPLGVCYIYFVAWHGPLDGDFVGSNLNALSGCYNISNAIIVNRESILGGSLTTDLGLTSLNICSGDGIEDSFSTVLTNNSNGYLESFVLTDETGLILDLPTGPTFDLEGYGPLTCHLYHITYAPGIGGLAIGSNKVNLTGCYGLSNPIEVHKDFVDGGALALASGGTTVSVCSFDGLEDPIEFVVTDNVGSTCSLVFTSLAGDILAIENGPIVDLDDIGDGSGDMLVYNVCYTEPINNFAIGFNINKWSTCFALSNPVTVVSDCIAADGPVSFYMYPNPATEILNININAIPAGKGGYIMIRNMTGQVVERIAVESEDQFISVDISRYDAGAYMLLMGSYKSEKIESFIKIE